VIVNNTDARNNLCTQARYDTTTFSDEKRTPIAPNEFIFGSEEEIA